VADTFSVHLRLLPEAQGGRETPMKSGYRSIMRFGTADAEPAWGVQIGFDADDLQPGEEREVRVSTWADDDPPVTSAAAMWLYEGARLVGTGTIR
jgi:translation elongation factor EF-Tu-like GTPase